MTAGGLLRAVSLKPVASGFVEIAFDGGEEGLSIDRLGHVVVASGFQALLAVAGHRVGGQGDDGVAPAGLAEAARCFEPVQLGHLYVHEDQIVRPSFGGGQGGAFTCNASVLGQIDLKARLPQDKGDQALVVQAVLGQQHAAVERVMIDAWRLLVLLGRSGRFAQHGHSLERTRIDRQGERASFARFTGDVDVSVEHAGKPVGDGQAQTSAAETSRRGGVGLNERIEELLDGLGRNADTRVADGKADPGRVARGDWLVERPDLQAIATSLPPHRPGKDRHFTLGSDGSIEYAQEDGDWEPPREIKGYRRDPDNSWRFEPLWPVCYRRVPRSYRSESCGCIKVTMKCMNSDSTVYDQDISDSQCQQCPVRVEQKGE